MNAIASNQSPAMREALGGFPLSLPAPSEDQLSRTLTTEQRNLFAAVAGLLGAHPDPEGAPHLLSYRFGRSELPFYFSTDWRDGKRGIVAACLSPESRGANANGTPSIGFSLSRTPKAIAADIRRRWLSDATAWHWERRAVALEMRRKLTEVQLRVEALMKANGCDFSHDEANTYQDRFTGHGITFQQYDLSSDSYHGFRVQLEIHSEAALRMIAAIAGEDFRMKCSKNATH